jgi:hypothetical protein
VEILFAFLVALYELLDAVMVWWSGGIYPPKPVVDRHSAYPQFEGNLFDGNTAINARSAQGYAQRLSIRLSISFN